MIISIAIADTNRDYIERLAEGLQQYNDLNISVFTSGERLQKTLVNEKYDVVLFDSDISEKRLMLSNAKLVMCLYSDDTVNGELYTDVDKVLKYQRISNIYKEILKKYSEKAGYSLELETSRKSSVLAVYSPIGGSGKTLVSIAIASKLEEQGRDVLYISAEQLGSSAALFPYKEPGTTALIEALNSNAVFALKLQGVAKNGMNGISYIEGFERIVDFDDVTMDEMKDLLVNIKKAGVYDVVIVDMDSAVGNVTKAVFEEADNIVVVNKPGFFASEKMRMFANQGIVTDNRSKMFVVKNFIDNGVRYNDELDVPEIGRVRNYGNLDEKKVIQMINMANEIDVTRV